MSVLELHPFLLSRASDETNRTRASARMAYRYIMPEDPEEQIELLHTIVHVASC